MLLGAINRNFKFEPPLPPIVTEGFPVISNFRIDNSNPNRLLFNSNEVITGTDSSAGWTGFTISGKTITGLTIQSGLTTGHYFTVSAAFDFFSNNHIGYEGGSDIADLDTNGVYNFNSSYIFNYINEPSALINRYVSVSGAGAHDGTSEANAWTFAEALSNAVAGQTVWIKAGDYGNTQQIVSVSGSSATNPIKFIGYKTTIGDITTPLVDTFTYTSPANAESQLDSSEYPVLNGTNVASSEGLFISGRSNLIFKNIQIREFSYCTFTNNVSTNILFENMTAALSYFGTGDGLGFFIGATTTASKIRYKNCLSFDNGGVNYRSYGTDNAYIGCKSYCGIDGNASTDYHFNLQKSNYTIFYGNEAHRTAEISHGSHGFGIKSGGSATTCSFNLFENNKCFGVQDENYYAAHQETHDNVFKNNTGYNNPAWTIDGTFLKARGGAYDNVFENNYGENFDYAIYMDANTEDQPIISGSVATNNLFKNNIFNNVKNCIVNSNRAGEGDYNIQNNKIYNNTFYIWNVSTSGLFYDTSDSPDDLVFSGNEVKNNIFYGQYNNTNLYKSTSVAGNYLQQYNDYYRMASTPAGTGNVSVNPNFVDTTNFVPQNASLKAGVAITGIEYDKDGTERDSTPTMGPIEI